MAYEMSDEELEKRIKQECHRFDMYDSPPAGAVGFVLWCFGFIILLFLIGSLIVKCIF